MKLEAKDALRSRYVTDEVTVDVARRLLQR